MIFIAVLVILGSALVFLETVLVGGVWAAAGLGFFAWAIYESHAQFGVAAALGTGAFCAFMCAAAFWVWLYVIPKTSLGKKLYLTTSQDGHAPSENFKELIGMEGSALTALVPSGKVLIGGKPFDAKCVVGHVEKNEKVSVVGSDPFELKVRPLK